MKETKQTGGWLGRHRKLLLFGGPAFLILVAASVHYAGLNSVSTDDAYVRAARIEISPSIAGRVVELDVKDNQEVREGQILFRLDDRDEKIAVREAEEALASTRLRIAALKANYRKKSADELAAREKLSYLEREWERQKKLQARGASKGEELDSARHSLEMAKYGVDAAREEKENLKFSLAGNPEIEVDNHPDVKLATAKLARAELALSYTIVKSPSDGIVTRVENLGKGDYIKEAAPVFSLLSEKEIWIEANFRETDLARMKPGERAEVVIDAYPGEKFEGKVQSLSPGTGSSFSILPVENATGNWVKVVQRLPVRISLDAQHPLRAGLSATVKVDLR
ncbi:MAG: HlyD family secretion protein [Burkholderiales bacterium]|nr:HlyD family secretion protein [Burkholderiales bacterium]